MHPWFPYRCPHLFEEYWRSPYWRCTRCIVWEGLVDLFAALVLLGIFAFVAVHLR